MDSTWICSWILISDFAEVIYKTTNYWDKDCEKSLFWDDKKISINGCRSC